MFDFEKLSVYQKTLALNKQIFNFLKRNPSIDYFLQKQLKRSSTSIALNIAEGVGRFSAADRKRFYVISRGSAFEVYATLQLIFNQYDLDQSELTDMKLKVTEISKMLFGLLKGPAQKIPKPY